MPKATELLHLRGSDAAILLLNPGRRRWYASMAVELCDDAAALAYACEIVRELMQGLTHADRSSLVKFRDETRPMVFSIPFFAACA
jgi:hypothetical protein